MGSSSDASTLGAATPAQRLTTSDMVTVAVIYAAAGCLWI